MTDWHQHPVVVSLHREKTIFDSERNDIEGIADIKDGIERTILLHCWAHTAACPACGVSRRYRSGRRSDEVVGCELCETVVLGIVWEIDVDLV